MTHMFTFVVIVGKNASKINSCQFSLQQNARLFNNTYRNVSDHEDKLKEEFEVYTVFKNCLFG